MRALHYLNPFRFGLNIVFVGVLVFLLAPLIVVIPASFSPGTVLEFPPDGLSWRWYEDFWGDQKWRQVTWLSVRLAFSVAILTTVIALMAAVGLSRFVKRGKGLLRGIIISPLIVPLIISSVGIFYVMNELTQRYHIPLLRTYQGILIGHTILALPFAVIIIESALRNYDVALEEAATSLGASRLLAFRKITIPIIAPSIAAAAVAAFITSWDEVLLVLFIGGVDAQTLPNRMFEFLTTQIRPTIAAISTMLIVTLFAVILIAQLLRIQQARSRRVVTPADEYAET